VGAKRLPSLQSPYSLNSGGIQLKGSGHGGSSSSSPAFGGASISNNASSSTSGVESVKTTTPKLRLFAIIGRYRLFT
jgi:hypothetical protein